MTTSLVIVLIILGQMYLALFYFSKQKNELSSIKKKSHWPKNLKYSVPLLTWLIYLNLFGEIDSILIKYKKIILISLILVMIFLRYASTSKHRASKWL